MDGPDPEGEAVARSAFQGSELRVFHYDRAGYIVVRRRMLAEARGRVLVSLNDDVEPCESFLTVHAREQAAGASRGTPAIIVGSSPWKRPPAGDDSLFDRLVRETGLIFFYDEMMSPGALAEPMRDWGYRHCFGLNFSAPLAMVRDVGGFHDMPLTYGYDDIELAYRLIERFSTPVLFRPGAVAIHDHRYTPADVIRREEALGRAAWTFAAANPAFARDLFGRDIRSEGELAYSREFIGRERTSAERVEREFLALAAVRADSVAADASSVLRALAQQFTLAKRWRWRSGLLEAASGVAPRRLADRLLSPLRA